MKRIFVLSTAAFAATAVFAAGPVVLKNGTIRVDWEPAHGDIVSLVDRQTRRDFVDRTATVPIYSLRFPLGNSQTTSLTSRDARSIQLRQEVDSVVIEAVHQIPAPPEDPKPATRTIRVTCRFTLEKSGRFVAGRIGIVADAPIRLSAVQFPNVAIPLPLSCIGDDDCLLLPVCDGYIIRNPAKYTFDRALSYPGGASMQLMAAYDRDAGVYLASRDGAGYAKRLVARCRNRSLTLSVDHLLPELPVEAWELPYDVALTTLNGPAWQHKVTWETAADLYREWAVQQPWCRTPLVQRVASGDVPRWLSEPSLFYAFSLNGQLPDRQQGDRLPLVVEHARKLRETLGMPITFMMMAWEKHGAWVTPDYFPPYGGRDVFADVTRQLHQQGDHTLVFLSGLRWTLQKEFTSGKPPYDNQAEFDRSARKYAISDGHGEPLVTGKPDADVGRFAQICAATPLGREILSAATAGCQGLGIDCVQADQIVGGGQPPCYHPQHGHPPGGGNWLSQALYKAMDGVRREGKARDRNFAFSIEEPGEFYIPVLDTYHARDYAQVRWPRSDTGAEGVPLFTHVYHDYLHGYGGDSCGVSTGRSRKALYEQAMNLVCGKTPAVAIWRNWGEPSQIDAAQRRLLRGHAELWRGPAHDFLVFGRRVATPALDVPLLEIVFSGKPPQKPRTLQFPAVLDSLWELPDGRRGRVFACIADGPVTLTVDGQKIVLAPGETAFRPVAARF